MLIAVPVANGTLCSHFGHCEQFAFIAADPASKQIQSTKHLTPPPHEPGVIPRGLHEQGVNVVLAGGMGERAQKILVNKGVQVIVGVPVDSPENLATAHLAGTLISTPHHCDHHH